jgi:uncharacterized protein YciI
MQFILLGFDGTDPEAAERRLRVRQNHLDKISLMKKRGEVLFGGAILSDDGKMTGSMNLKTNPMSQREFGRKLKSSHSGWQKLNNWLQF